MSIARSSTPIIAGLAVLLLSACRDAPPEGRPVLRLVLPEVDELVLGGGTDYEFGLALAPDGRHLVFAASRRAGDTGALFLRDLRSADVREVPGTAGGVLPFWSSDGGQIGFFAAGKLKSLHVATGEIRDLADAPSPRGGVWLQAGELIFAPAAEGGLMRRAADGTVTPLTHPGAGEISHRFPQLLGESHVIFFVRAREPARQGIWIAPLDQPDARRRLASSDAAALIAEDAVVYSNGGALVMSRVDVEALSLRGPPVVVATTVGHGTQHELFATFGGDVLIHGRPPSRLRELRWLDATAATLSSVGEPMHAWEVRTSPTGQDVAVTRVDPQLNTLDIWTYRGDRPVPRRLSTSINVDETPAWSPTGSRLGWVTGRSAITLRDANAASPETVLRNFERPVRLTDWSATDWLVLSEAQGDGRGDIILMRPRFEGEVREYLRSPFNETSAAVSPDGRWLAYSSDESGQAEIYVDAFPTPRARSRISVGGGAEPRWSRDGSRVYFRRGRDIHVARVAPADGALEAVSSERLVDAGAEIRSFDIDPVTGRVLVNVPAEGADSAPLSVLVNATSLLPSAP